MYSIGYYALYKMNYTSLSDICCLLLTCKLAKSKAAYVPKHNAGEYISIIWRKLNRQVHSQ